MTNTTPTYWDINGTSLQTFAQNIVTLGADRIAPPPVRGGNLVVPATYGQLYVPKIPDARLISLGMWVSGANPDGSKPNTESPEQLFQDNFRALRNLIVNNGAPFALTKRFYVSGTLKSAAASAEFASGLNPVMNGPASASMTVDLSLADPYFYGSQVNVNLTNGANTVTIGGDATTRRVLLQFNGARVNPTVYNSTTGTQVTYTGTLLTGDINNLDIYNFTSKTTPSGMSQFDTTGAITHAGGFSWLTLQPGANTITLSSTSGSGTVTLSYQEAYD